MDNPSDLILRKLRCEDEKAFLGAINSWDKKSQYPFAPNFNTQMTIVEYLQLLSANEKGEELHVGYVPMTMLFGFVAEDCVGRFTIRHSLNEQLFKTGGHIGYVILPQFRKKGYAKAMLIKSLPFVRELGITKALITCDDNNIGSLKVIEACGGVIENKIDMGQEKPLKRRYWIDTATKQ